MVEWNDIHSQDMIPIPGQTKGLSVDGGSLFIESLYGLVSLEGANAQGDYPPLERSFYEC